MTKKYLNWKMFFSFFFYLAYITFLPLSCMYMREEKKKNIYFRKVLDEKYFYEWEFSVPGSTLKTLVIHRNWRNERIFHRIIFLRNNCLYFSTDGLWRKWQFYMQVGNALKSTCVVSPHIRMYVILGIPIKMTKCLII